ncbi:WbqC family protein [Erwinia typographi]|nr:WbqC family protein [Erwinia typographi]
MLHSFSSALPEGKGNHTVAIMQPYIFPYIGYFNLIEACDTFVFYDDVNYIKKGWVNRNRLLGNGQALRFTVPLVNASQNSLICESRLHNFSAFKTDFIKMTERCYSHAPYFESTMGYIETVLNATHQNIADVAISSVREFYRLLATERHFLRSSLHSPETRGMGKAERLIAISKQLNAENYVNAMGGMDLYCRDDFSAAGVRLEFINPQILPYGQRKTEKFIPGLSIIDVLMNNNADDIKKMLFSYERV